MVALCLLLLGRCEERALVAALGGWEAAGALTSVTAMRWAAGLLWVGSGMGTPRLKALDGLKTLDGMGNRRIKALDGI